MKKSDFILLMFLLIYGCSPIDIKKEYYADGSIKTIQSYVLGRRDGYKVDYYPDHLLSDSSSWRDDVLEGEYKEFFDNGRLKTIGHYSKGLPSGNWVSFHLNGRIEKEESYSNGKINGIQKSYDDSGQLWRESSYKNGMVVGSSKDYYSNGHVQSETVFRDDMPISKEFYYKDGKTKMLVYYQNGNIYENKRYDEDGMELIPSNRIITSQSIKDTFQLGDTLEIKINFIEQEINSLTDKHILIGSLDEDDSLTDVNIELPLIKNSYSIYRKKTEYLGLNHITGVLRYTKSNGHKVDAPFFWDYYVTKQ